MIRTNRRLTFREISNAFYISYSSLQLVLTKNLNMRRVNAKFVPRFLQQEQKEFRLSISLELRDHASLDSGFLRSLITAVESWVWNENAEFSRENAELAVSKESTSIEIKCESYVDRFLRYWRNCSIWVRVSRHHSELRILQRSIRTPTKRCATKRSEKWKNGFVLHHGNGQCHTPLIIRQFLADEKLPCVPIHHIRQTWYPVISGYSQKLNSRWNENILTRFQRWRLQRKAFERVNERQFEQLLQRLSGPCIDRNRKGNYFESD
jgi:hypothetical protein